MRKSNRTARINAISKKLVVRFEKHQEKNQGHKRRKPLVAKERTRVRIRHLIAYDLETTRIESGTPKPLYLTAFNDDIGFSVSIPVRNLKHLLEILETRFLLEDYNHARFVGWNANNFDVYFVAAALLHSDSYILRPYLTKSKKIRGLKVIAKTDETVSWEFLDGMSMTGIQKPLKDFLKVFAPEHQKLEAPDFEHEEFNAHNPAHVDYAMRDSVGLWHGLQAAEAIVKEHFKLGLQPTIGNLGIKAFQAHLPRSVKVWAMPMPVIRIVRNYVMRGGYCYCNRKYHGPVWKYDINQAYAAAMREAWLPAGSVVHTSGVHKYAKCAIYLVNAKNLRNTVPFYWRDLEQSAQFTIDEILGTWITSIEYEQLKREGWEIDVMDGYFWDDHFKMKAYVDKLENLRVGEGRDPKSAQGEMVKAIGNNSYGKTVEQLEGIELILARECPEGFSQYQDDDELFKHIWFRFSEPGIRDYHQPHIGAFITAQVRMVLRRAILLNPGAWIYADTDGVMFSEPVDLPLSQTEYGKWKLEAAGEIYRIIAKKVYANEDASEKHAKGININRLSEVDFINWFNGSPPVQTQIQRSNFLAAMSGENMFFERVKVGQK